LQHSKLAEKYGSIATGWISRKKWGTIEKSGPDLVIVARSEAPTDDDEEILARLKNDILILEELPPVLKEAALRLTKRSLVDSQGRNDREVEITEAGRNIGTTAPSQREVSSLTGDMIVSGEWEKVKLRSYNVSSAVPRTYPGKYHPYLRFLRKVKRKLVALGFREAMGPLVGTAFSVRTMLSKDLQIPGKYFAIARCFRPDMLDKTHLTEFNQAEGIVLDPSLNLRNLLGILEMFAKEVAGADKVRFKPDYFPF